MNTSENTSESLPRARTLIDQLRTASALVDIERRAVLDAEGLHPRALRTLRRIDAGESRGVHHVTRLEALGWAEHGADGVALTAAGAELLDRVNAALAAIDARFSAAVGDGAAAELAAALDAAMAEFGGRDRLVAERRRRKELRHAFRAGMRHARGRFGAGHDRHASRDERGGFGGRGERRGFGGDHRHFRGDHPRFGGERHGFGGERHGFGGERHGFGGEHHRFGGERRHFRDDRPRFGSEHHDRCGNHGHHRQHNV